MFIATLFTMAKMWRKPKYPSIEKWKKTGYTNTVECSSVIRKKRNTAICDNVDEF